MPWVIYDIIELWYYRSMISWFFVYDIITKQTMISLLREIIDIWYHRQYHMQNHIWYHEIKTMISYFCIYDISNSWYHRPMISHMITSMISPMISQSLTQFCKQMISMWVYRIAQRAELGRGEEWNLTLARSGKLRNELWKSWMACALRPALVIPQNRCLPAPARWAQHHPRSETSCLPSRSRKKNGYDSRAQARAGGISNIETAKIFTLCWIASSSTLLDSQ